MGVGDVRAWVWEMCGHGCGRCAGMGVGDVWGYLPPCFLWCGFRSEEGSQLEKVWVWVWGQVIAPLPLACTHAMHGCVAAQCET